MANHGDQPGLSTGYIPIWDQKTSTLESYGERVKLYVMGTKKDDRPYLAARLLSVMDPDTDAFKIGAALPADVLEAPDGALKVVEAIKNGQGPLSMQEAVKYFLQLFRLQRKSGESMQKWTTRFKLHRDKVGRALHACQPDIPSTGFLHEILLGVMLLASSSLSPTEQAAVLATSGRVGKAGDRIGNSYKLEDLVQALIEQWTEEELSKRDRGHRRQAAHAANAGSLDLSALEDSLPDVDEFLDDELDEQQEFAGYADDEDEGALEEDVEQDYPAEAGDDEEVQMAEQAFAQASRTFEEARNLLQAVRSARGYFPVVGVGAYPSEAPPPPAGRGRGSGRPSSRGGGRGFSSRGRSQGGRPPSYRPPQQPPAKQRFVGRGGGVSAGQRGGPHHEPRGPRPQAAGPGMRVAPVDACILCGSKDHRAQNCPHRGQAGSGAARKRAFGSFVAMLTDAQGENWPENISVVSGDWEPIDAPPPPLDEYAAFDMAEVRGIGLLDGGATKSVGAFEEIQPLVDEARAAGLEVALTRSPMEFTFAGGEQTNSAISVGLPVPAFDENVISLRSVVNDHTPILLGLDTLRRYGIVVDYYTDRVYSHVLERLIPSVRLPSGHLGVDLTRAGMPE